MSFIVRILRFVFWMVIVAGSAALLRRIVGKMAEGGPRSQPDVVLRPNPGARKLVRDPICGMHMAETIAIPLRSGSELIHFCSMECREKYVSGTRKLAANA
jgi:hypothetical protein